MGFLSHSAIHCIPQFVIDWWNLFSFHSSRNHPFLSIPLIKCFFENIYLPFVSLQCAPSPGQYYHFCWLFFIFISFVAPSNCFKLIGSGPSLASSISSLVIFLSYSLTFEFFFLSKLLFCSKILCSYLRKLSEIIFQICLLISFFAFLIVFWLSLIFESII